MVSIRYLSTRQQKVHAVDAAGSAEDGSLYNFYTLCGRLINDPDQWREEKGTPVNCAHCRRSIVPTPAQQAALGALAAGGWIPSAGNSEAVASVYDSTIRAKHTLSISGNTVRALIAKGWIIRDNRRDWIISEAGRAAIKTVKLS